MASLSRRGLIILAVLAALALVPLSGDVFVVRMTTRIMIYGLAALALDLILGYGGMVSFGHAAYFGLGAYVVGIAAHHGFHEALVLWPAALLFAGLLALVVGAISLRTTGVSFIMITLAFAQMVFFLFSSLRPYGADDGMRLPQRNLLAGTTLINDHFVYYYVVLAILAAVLLLLSRVVGSRFGTVLRGVRQNERRMQAIGFPTYRYKLAAFVISGAVTGLAGGLLTNHLVYVSPRSLHWLTSGELIIMVVLGGIGSLVGPVLGAVGLLVAEEVLSGYTRHWQIVLGPLLLLVVLFARSGLYGWIEGRKR